jgi:restriction system protein
MKHGLGGLAFEIDVQERFASLGWQVTRTVSSGDFGADLVAQFENEKLVVQCKDYGTPAGVKAVQEVHYARTHYAATYAAVVARNGFTKAAIKAAENARVYILRPGDITQSGTFNRILQRSDSASKRLAAKEADEYARKSISWRDYDLAVQRDTAKILTRTRWTIGVMATWILFVTVSIYTQWYNPDHQAIRQLLFVESLFALIIWVIGRPAPPPQKPEFPRKGAIIKCRFCSQALRVDFGREGRVRCPKCNRLTAVAIPNADQSHADSLHGTDVSFFDP